jgi:hypothetical protein
VTTTRNRSRPFGATPGNEQLQRESTRTAQALADRGFGVQEVKTITIQGGDTGTVEHALRAIPVHVSICPLGEPATFSVVSKTRKTVVIKNGDVDQRTFEVGISG